MLVCAAMAGICEEWFPTAVWYQDVAEHAALRDGLLAAIRAERARDPQGRDASAPPLVWQSAPDLQGRPELAPFSEVIARCVMEVVAMHRWDLDKVMPELTGCDALVHAQNGGSAVQNHPRALLTGLYFVQSAAGGGGLFLLDPREAPALVAPPMTEYTRLTFERIAYEPTEGRLLILPAWLRYGLEPNRSESERIALRFQVGVRWK
jgi:uncharacterized protein (TIGR02466 family)